MPLSADTILQSTEVVIREIQQETYADEMQCLKHNKTLPKTSSLQKLDPFIDQSGLLRVGGRLVKADLSSEEKRPLIIPGRSHVANVGLGVFGPWSVSARKTRGGYAESKRWAVLFTCLNIRAIHIEVIESLNTSSFINALRRFLAIRGPVKQIRSDRGTNFVGACEDLQIPSNVDEKVVKKFLSNHSCIWKFNPLHSSHMGGAWERMIGLARRILDSMLLQMASSKLTHEVLTTFMAEVTAIINNRPLIPVSTDPADPFILTPATLLTQKTGASSVPPGDFVKPDLYKQQWRMVQSLASTFWDRWRKQYLATLQHRRKWQHQQPNISKGCIVLFKDSQSKRNDWPLGIITETYPSQDGKVRKVQVKIIGKE